VIASSVLASVTGSSELSPTAVNLMVELNLITIEILSRGESTMRGYISLTRIETRFI